MNKIITINRQFGSGGREVGKRLADELSIAYYDKELLEKMATESGLSAEYIAMYDEKSTRNFGYTFGRTFSGYQQSPSDIVQLNYTKVIRQVGEKGNAVIIGRCANQILQDQSPFKIFIYSSDMDFRVNRCFEKVPSDRETKSEKQMAKEILKIDKQRAKYHEFYTGQTWMDMSNYNLCIDTSMIGIRGAIDLIKYTFDQLK